MFREYTLSSKDSIKYICTSYNNVIYLTYDEVPDQVGLLLLAVLKHTGELAVPVVLYGRHVLVSRHLPLQLGRHVRGWGRGEVESVHRGHVQDRSLSMI